MADGMLSLSWNNHRATFCHILATLRDKERYTDVTVACEGKFYPVHKLVLSTCSEYFEKIFENTPCKHPVIVLKDVNRCDLEALFCYMYEGAVSVAQSNLGRLIKAAEVLRIKGLAVPDEPPISDSFGRRTTSSHHHHASDDRSSPHPKRRRREENSHTQQGRTHTSPSPPSSPRPSPLHDGGESHPAQRSQSDSQWGDHGTVDREDGGMDGLADDRLGDHSAASHSAPTPPLVEVMVDETLVKEEMIDQGETGQEDMMDSGMDYGSVGSDSRLEGSAGGGTEEDHMLPGKYEPKANPSQQAIPEAVVEALAGPSGMQTWLGGGEMPSGFTGLEGYTGEGGQDLHPPSQAPAAHQLVWRETISQEGVGRLPREGCQGTSSPVIIKLDCPSPSSSSTTTTTTTTTTNNNTSSVTTSSSFTSPYASVYASIASISSSIYPSVSISPCPTSPPLFTSSTISNPSSITTGSSGYTPTTPSYSAGGPQDMLPPASPLSPSSHSFSHPIKAHHRSRIHPHFTHSLHHLHSQHPHLRTVSQPSQFPSHSSSSSSLLPSSYSNTTAISSPSATSSSTSYCLETTLEDKKPFSCEYCPYKTSRKTAMKEHINSHTGKKPHACPFCPYRTCWNSSMVVHMRTHTGEKPYSCPHCNYQATQRSSLKAHLLTHQSPSLITTASTTPTSASIISTLPFPIKEDPSAITTTTATTAANIAAAAANVAAFASSPSVSTAASSLLSSLTSVSSQQSLSSSVTAPTPSLVASQQGSLSPIPTLIPISQQPSSPSSPPVISSPQHSPSTPSVVSLLPFQHTPSFLTTRHSSPVPPLASHHHTPSSLLTHLSSSFAMPASPSLAILQSSPSLQIPQSPNIAISHIASLSTPQSPSLSSQHPSFPR